MKDKKENIVGLITYDKQVQFLGVQKDQEIMDPQIYNDFDKIVESCSQIKNFCKPVQKYDKTLINNLNKIGKFGYCKVFPALLAAVQLASKGPVGFKVILCTDAQWCDRKAPQSKLSYNGIANYAKSKQVTISPSHIIGAYCDLRPFIHMSLATGGQFLKILPKEHDSELTKIVKDEILGMDCSLVLTVDKIFEIANQDPDELSQDKTMMSQNQERLTEETQFTSSFHLLTEQEVKLKGNIDLDLFKQPKVPIQIQLTYTNGNTSKYLKAVKKTKKVECFKGQNSNQTKKQKTFIEEETHRKDSETKTFPKATKTQ